MYDLILKGGTVIDPDQRVHETQDIAIKEGRIAEVAINIEPDAREVIPLFGKFVAPGFIDIHCHAAAGLVWYGVPPDKFGLNSGVALLCDGGSAGAANFQTMRRFIVEHAKTDIFCFLNLATTGLITLSEIRDEYDIDLAWSKQVIEENRDIIKGIKIRAIQPLVDGIGMKAVEAAKKLGSEVKLPVMLHIGEPRDRVAKESLDDFSRAAVRLMDKGDILSHFITWEAGGLILPDGEVYPELLEAQKRGVVLDVAHGMNHFSFAIARHALAQGLLPTTISTDLTTSNQTVIQSLAVTMSKLLNLGLTIDQVIEMATTNPARALGEEDRWGSLKIDMPANITVFELVKGDFLFSDGNGRGSLKGTVLIEPRLVLKDGVSMPCSSGYAIPTVYSEIHTWQTTHK